MSIFASTIVCGRSFFSVHLHFLLHNCTYDHRATDTNPDPTSKTCEVGKCTDGAVKVQLSEATEDLEY